MSLIFALVAFQAATFDPAKDPAYAKPVTVHLAMVPLKTLVASLEKSSGQPLTASGVVSDWKATMLVKNLPAGRAMESLADTMGLVWKHEGSSTILGRPEGASSESDYLKSERADRERGAPPAPSGIPVAPGMIRRPGRGAPARRVDTGGAGAVRPGYSRFDPTLLAVETMDSAPPSRLDPALPSGDGAFAKAALSWPSVPEKVDAAWSKSIAPANLGRSEWAGGQFALSDLLVAWHDATGLPVVADAFRVPMAEVNLNIGPALTTLQSVAANNRVSLRLADGVARLRHPGFWRLREQEIPDTTWNSVERSKKVGLDDYATFAARLTPAQAAAFRSAEPPLSRVPTDVLRESYPGLRLWAALPTNVRRALQAGTPVGLAGFPNLTNAYLFALREAPYYHAGDPRTVLALPPARLGLFGAPSESGLALRLSGEGGGGVTYALPK